MLIQQGFLFILHLKKLYKMLLEEANKLLSKLIEEGRQNIDRQRTVDLADKYYKLSTGEGIESLLIRYVQREDSALFEQRVRLTRSITPAVAASIRKPFNKVVRNDRVRSNVETNVETRTKNIYSMIEGFYGANRKKNRGLDYWLKTRFLELQFTDPNAWVVLEWSQPQNPAEVISPKPFEVSSQMAQNWLIINNEVKWLHVKQDIIVSTVSSATTALPNTPDIKILTANGVRHTIYDEDVTIVYEQIDEKYLKHIGYEKQPNERFEKINQVNFLVKEYSPNIGYVPAFRVGYIRDEVTKGRTFVNPWHDALCFFEKSLKAVSEMDLTMSLHVFPQKLQYVQRCQGEEKNGRPMACRSGKMPNGDTCKTCKGAGYQIHTTTADVINVPLPEDAKDMFNLDQMLVYKSPPLDLVKFQNDYIQQLQSQAHQAVFNSQIFVRKQYSNNESGGESPTATESDYNMQSVYDTLEPFTEKYSELWMDVVTTFGVIAGAKIEEIQIVHAFPADFKLKTSDILLAERGRAATSGAPSFMIESIDDDLADILYTGDSLKSNKYYIKRRYFPFPGKSADEVSLLLASEYVPKYYKVLYSNFDEIFKEIEKTNPEIWSLKVSEEKLDAIVATKVDEFINKLEANRQAVILSAFRTANPANTEEDSAVA